MVWETLRILIIGSSLIADTFLTFFIWEKEKDLKIILFYGLAYFIAIPIFSLISGFISEHLQPKIALLLSNWARIIQLFAIIYFQDDLRLENIMFIAFLGGISEGMTILASNVIDFDKGIKEHAGFFATRAIIKEALTFIIPLSAAFFIAKTQDFQALFSLTIGILFINVFLTTIIKYKHARSTFDIKHILSFPGTNPDKKILVAGSFLEGLSEGITLTIFPIMLLYLAGSILNWGFLNTLLVISAIITSILIKRFVNDSNYKYLYVFGAFGFAALSVFLITDFNLFIFVVFLLAKSVMDVIKDVSFYATIEQMMSEDKNEYNLHAEYEFLAEASTSIGRLLPIIVLIAININTSDQLLFRLIFIVVGILPLLTLSVLGKSAILKD